MIINSFGSEGHKVIALSLFCDSVMAKSTEDGEEMAGIHRGRLRIPWKLGLLQCGLESCVLKLFTKAVGYPRKPDEKQQSWSQGWTLVLEDWIGIGIP